MVDKDINSQNFKNLFSFNKDFTKKVVHDVLVQNGKDTVRTILKTGNLNY